MRGDLARTVTALLLIVGALVSCGLLSAFSRSEQVYTTAALDDSIAKAPYHLLVRPPSAVRQLEADHGLVKPGFLADDFGGLSIDEWKAVQGLPGISVAAPLANIGMPMMWLMHMMRLPEVFATRVPAAYRVQVNGATTGTVDIPGPETRLIVLADGDQEEQQCPRSWTTSGIGWHESLPAPLQLRTRTICMKASEVQANFADFRDGFAYLSMPVPLAGVDPAAEEALTGESFGALTKTQVRDSPNLCQPSHTKVPVVPTLFASSVPSQVKYDIKLERLDWQTATANPGNEALTLQSRSQGASEQLLDRKVATGDELYQAWVNRAKAAHKPGELPEPEVGGVPVMTFSNLFQRSEARTEGVPGHGLALRVKPVENDSGLYLSKNVMNGYQVLPQTVNMGDSRKLRMAHVDVAREACGYIGLNYVGTFAQEDWSGQQKSNGNPAGYAQSLVALKVPLETIGDIDQALSKKALSSTEKIPALINTTAPISVIRVRVEGVTGSDKLSQERLRLAAQRIRETTGAVVEIMAGSSTVPVTIDFPSPGEGKKLLPGTTLKMQPYRGVEHWSKKGVAVAGLISAMVLFGATTLANVNLHPLVLAGVVPGAIALAVLAGLLPAVKATRGLQHSDLSAQRRTGLALPRGSVAEVTGFGLVLRRPGRLLAAMIVTAACVASVGVLVVVQFLYRGAIAGTAMGDALTVQVRTADLVTLGLLASLSVIATGVLVHLGILDDRGPLAALVAVGWGPLRVARVLAAQSVTVTFFSGVVGVVAGRTKTLDFVVIVKGGADDHGVV